jgi:hypothetical protein
MPSLDTLIARQNRAARDIGRVLLTAGFVQRRLHCRHLVPASQVNGRCSRLSSVSFSFGPRSPTTNLLLFVLDVLHLGANFVHLGLETLLSPTYGNGRDVLWHHVDNSWLPRMAYVTRAHLTPSSSLVSMFGFSHCQGYASCIGPSKDVEVQL